MKNTDAILRPFFIAVLLIIAASYTQAQTVTKYYDIHWGETSKDRAVYYGEYIKEGDTYNYTAYSVKSNGIRSKGVYGDTSFAKPIGLVLGYNDKGKLIDSTLHENGVPVDVYHYYDNGQLEVHYYVPVTTGKGVTEAYDEAGGKIKNYVYMKEAEFKGGDAGWKAYLIKNLAKEFTVKKKGDPTTVTVHIQFVISETGQVIQPKVLKSSGLTYIDREAIGVISASPQWSNAVFYNKPVKAYRVQPMTYILKDK
jgi:TonB family protein